jgi:hypothetical protein
MDVTIVKIMMIMNNYFKYKTTVNTNYTNNEIYTLCEISYNKNNVIEINESVITEYFKIINDCYLIDNNTIFIDKNKLFGWEIFKVIKGSDPLSIEEYNLEK